MESKKKSDTSLKKWRFYFVSLSPLFILLSFKTIGLHFQNNIQSKHISHLIELISPYVAKFLPATFFFLALLGIGLSYLTEWEWRGTFNPPFEVEEITSQSYEYLTFLTAIIIPLCCFSFTQIWDVVVFVLLIVLIGLIFSRMDLYFSNPTLAILRYKLYSITVNNHNELGRIIVITKDSLKKGSKIIWLKIDENVWIVKEIK